MDLQELKRRLGLYLEAERAILGGAQSYTIGERQLTRADLKYIQNAITALVEEINAAEYKLGGRKRVTFIE